MRLINFIMEADEDQLVMLSKDLHTLLIQTYYSKYCKDDNDTFSIAEKISKVNPESILDVGCGYNSLKSHMSSKGYLYNDQFIGIDPFNDAADVKVSVEQYWYENQDQQFDVVLALDSINIGDQSKILEQVTMIDNLTKQGGLQFWQVSIGEDINCPEFPLVNLIDFYPWTKEFVERIANVNNYEIREFEEQINSNGDKILYFCFYKY